MIFHGSFRLLLFAPCRRVDQFASLHADPLTDSLCSHRLGLGINKLKLQRRTAAVYHQYFHCFLPRFLIFIFSAIKYPQAAACFEDYIPANPRLRAPCPISSDVCPFAARKKQMSASQSPVFPITDLQRMRFTHSFK